MAALSEKREIPSLDGLRALSISLVIFSHCAHALPLQLRSVIGFQILGQHSVDIFFVISGFLITHLLLKELERTGGIDLRRFFLRRFFRIFPAFYVFMAAVALLWAARVVSLNAHSFLCASTYTLNYCRNIPGWTVSHCWSLSLEEQFYLLWPPSLLLLGRRGATYLAAAIIALSPVSRVVSYYLAPSFRGQEGLMLHTRLDTIMFGCLIALVSGTPAFEEILPRLIRSGRAVALGCLFLLASPVLEMRFGAKYLWTVGYTLQGIFISLMLLFAVRKPLSGFGRVLNARLVRHIGVISYSLYLWQQLFTEPDRSWFPFNLVLLGIVAEASFFLVERPALRLRDRVEARLRVSRELQAVR